MAQIADLSKTLEQIGLTEKEARVYLALLSLESATAYRIAENCEVKKPTVYIILEDLRKKGLALKIPHAKKALFAARDIGEYLEEQEAHIKAVRSIAPKLHDLGIKNKSNVYFYTGSRGVMQAVEHKFERMRDKTFHSFYGDLANASEELVRLLDTWDRKAVAINISFKLILPRVADDSYQKNLINLAKTREDLIDIRFLEQYVYPSNTHLEIAEDFVRIIDSKNLSATIIDDKPTADAMRQIFQIVWEKGV